MDSVKIFLGKQPFIPSLRPNSAGQAPTGPSSSAPFFRFERKDLSFHSFKVLNPETTQNALEQEAKKVAQEVFNKTNGWIFSTDQPESGSGIKLESDNPEVSILVRESQQPQSQYDILSILHKGVNYRYEVKGFVQSSNAELVATNDGNDDMNDFGSLNDMQKKFVNDYGGKLLEVAGYNDKAINNWSKLTASQRILALDYGKELHEMGYDGNAINDWTKMSKENRGLALKTGQKLHDNVGYDGNAINDWTKMSEKNRGLVIKHGKKLYQKAGYNSKEIKELLQMNGDVKYKGALDSVIKHGEKLHEELGYETGKDINLLLINQRGWLILAEHGLRLRDQFGCTSRLEMDAFLDLNRNAQNFVLEYGQKLLENGYKLDDIYQWADLAPHEQCERLVEKGGLDNKWEAKNNFLHDRLRR